MDIKAYIESGILEDYVLGVASEKEMREVRCLSSIYSELNDEIVAIERRLMQVSETVPVEMPKLNMADLMSKIEQTPQLPAKSMTVNEPPKQEAKVVKMSSRNVWQVAAAALLFLSAFTLYYAMQKTNKNTDLVMANSAIQAEMDRMNLELNQNKLMAEIVGGKDVKKIALNSMDSAVNQYASVYWNASLEEVYLDAKYLPNPPDGKQYQLWALKDGVPIDQGMVAIGETGVQRMKNVAAADAFAITLEDVGGKPVPTMEQLKVLGKV